MENYKWEILSNTIHMKSEKKDFFFVGTKAKSINFIGDYLVLLAHEINGSSKNAILKMKEWEKIAATTAATE